MLASRNRWGCIRAQAAAANTAGGWIACTVWVHFDSGRFLFSAHAKISQACCLLPPVGWNREALILYTKFVCSRNNFYWFSDGFIFYSFGWTWTHNPPSFFDSCCFDSSILLHALTLDYGDGGSLDEGRRWLERETEMEWSGRAEDGRGRKPKSGWRTGRYTDADMWVLRVRMDQSQHLCGPLYFSELLCVPELYTIIRPLVIFELKYA